MVTGRGGALRALWTGCCTIFVREPVVNEQNGQTSFAGRPATTDEPCRLSYHTVKTVEGGGTAALVTQTVKLFLDAAVVVSPGSKLTVTQNGVTRDYEKSGEPAIYCSHQEIPLQLFGGWA